MKIINLQFDITWKINQLNFIEIKHVTLARISCRTPDIFVYLDTSHERILSEYRTFVCMEELTDRQKGQPTRLTSYESVDML